MYIPSTTWTWSFMLVTIAQAALGLALEGYVFGRFQYDTEPGSATNQSAKTVYTYLSLFIFGFLYQIFLVWDALRLNNTIQVIGVCLYDVGLLIYAVVQVDQFNDAILDPMDPAASPIPVDLQHSLWHDFQPFLIAIPIVITIGALALSAIAWKLYREFSWSIYKNISADLRMKRRYLVYQVYISLLKFDFFFFLSFSVQFLVMVDGTSNLERALTAVALFITIPILFFAGFSAKKESVTAMCCTIFLYFGAMAYFLFKLIRMYDASSARVAQYLPARRGLTTFAVITIFLLICTIFNAAWCTMNFGQGLKTHINKRRIPDFDGKASSYDDSSYNGVPLGQVHSRMTID